jgi:outer membrane lipoprotein carrier protein
MLQISSFQFSVERICFAIILIAFNAVLKPAIGQIDSKNGLEQLASFVRAAQSGQAEFTQVVTAPAKEGQSARSKTSSGSFEFLRPGRFKFHYKKPFEQIIVADGETLWLHDLDLNQVTQRKQSAVLANTPAALIASASDLGAFRNDFTLEAAPDAEGLAWVLATPKAKDAQIKSVRVGFKTGTASPELAQLEILDNFGQRSVIKFSNLKTNQGPAAAAFAFKPPAGADILRQ